MHAPAIKQNKISNFYDCYIAIADISTHSCSSCWGDIMNQHFFVRIPTLESPMHLPTVGGAKGRNEWLPAHNLHLWKHGNGKRIKKVDKWELRNRVFTNACYFALSLVQFIETIYIKSDVRYYKLTTKAMLITATIKPTFFYFLLYHIVDWNHNLLKLRAIMVRRLSNFSNWFYFSHGCDKSHPDWIIHCTMLSWYFQ